MLNCRDVMEHASDYLDKTLTWRQRMGIWLHLQICHHCRRYVRQFRMIIVALTRMPTPEITEEAMRQHVDIIKKYNDTRRSYGA